MNVLNRVLETIANHYSSDSITTVGLMSMLLVVAGLAIYEFLVYRLMLHRAFYNRSFNVTIAVLPFFISTIIMCLQSNIVITLGTIGALAIIRFRTAVKDPVDMIYILWSIHIGIICGCQLYEVAVLTSLLVTVFLLVFSYVKIGGKNYCLVVRLRTGSDEEEFVSCLKEYAKKYKMKSRNYSGKGIDCVVECTVREPRELSIALEKNAVVERFSLLEYDVEDIV